MVNGTRYGYMEAINQAADGGKASAQAITDAELTEQKLGRLPGSVYYYENKTVSGSNMYMENILAGMAEHIAEQRAIGIDVRVVFWDYIQQYPLKNYTPGSSNVEEQKLRLFRQWCKINKICGWSVTQVTKAAAARVRGHGDKRSGGYLYKTDMQYLREDAGNLILIWQPRYLTIEDKRISCTTEEWDAIIKYGGHEGQDGYVFHNRMGEPELQGEALLFPAKNSVAKVSGFGKFKFDWQHVRVVER